MSPPSNHVNNGSEKALVRGAVGAGITAALAGGFYLFSWLSGTMASRGLHAYTLKTNTSICLILCGISLALGTKRTHGKGTRRAGRALAVVAVAIALLTLVEHLLGVDLGIDQLVAEEETGAMGATSPNRMPFSAAVGFTLCSSGILLLHARENVARLVQSLGIATCLVSLPGILGHLYQLEGPYVVPTIAWPTAASIFILGIGLLLARPRDALMGVVTSGTPGGMLMRRLLVPAIILPILLGWLHLQGQLWGLYELDLGTSILVIAWMVIFSLVASQAGRRADVQQRILEEQVAGEALRESEEKFRALFHQAAVGMGRVNFTDARWTDVNQAFCAMLGYSQEEMLATPWPEITHPDDLDLDLVPFREMTAGKLESYSVEKRFIHKEGRHVWARLTLSLARDALGRPDYEIAIIEDITSRKQAEAELREAKDELELRVRERTRELEEAYSALKRETEQRLAAVEDLREKEQLLIQQSRLAAMGEMLGNIAHQWRQPLNVLGLLIQSLRFTHDKGLLTGEALAGEVTKGMNIIKHMSQTIDDFKDFLKEEKESREFSVNSAVTATVALLEASLRNANVTVEVDESAELTITGHRNEFSHVILNIINNARDALKEKAIPAPKIVIRIAKEGEAAVVTIADNAGGVPEEIIGRIFEPYFTTKGPEKGTGIGLFMSRSIMEKMGGRLSVRNSSEGAEFRIEF